MQNDIPDKTGESPLLLSDIISCGTFIDAPIEKVFDTLTTASGWDAWFTHGMELDPHIGGIIVFRWKDFGPDSTTISDHGEVLEISRPERFVFTWHPAGEHYPTTVKFRLTPRSSGTMLSLHESGYPDTEQGRKMLLSCATGWGEALTLLKFYLEYGLVYQPPRERVGG